MDGTRRIVDGHSAQLRRHETQPHLHVVALDGLYVAGADGRPVFRALGRLKTDEVADVVQIAKIRVLKALERRGVVRVSAEDLEVTTPSRRGTRCWRNWRQPPLPGCRPRARERKREPVAIATGGPPEIVGDLVVQDCGFNLHAKTHAGALDDDARARLLRYVLRPPLSQERLTVLPDHRSG